jgi:hypothetical protein
MSDPLRELYDRSSTFGRDFFHYIVAALVLTFFLSVGFVLSRVDASPALDVLTGLNLFWSAVVMVAFVTLLYGVGQVLLAVGFFMDACWKRTLARWDHVRRHAKARGWVDSIAKRLFLNEDTQGAEDEDCHLVLEMLVMKSAPELHARFVERYNTLVHLRLGIASALMLAGLTNLSWLLIAPSVALVVLSAALLLTGLMMERQVVISQTRFLSRVAAAAVVAERPNTARIVDGTSP